MKVAFLHMEACSQDPVFQRRLASIMVKSVKQFPDVWVLQMTDMQTPAIEGIDEIRRLVPDSTHMMIYRLRHLALLRGEYLFLDTDIVVLKNPAKVFDLPFDVALTKRDKRIVSHRIGYTEKDPLMPFNTGVMFSRSQDFWKDSLEVCRGLEERHKQWYGDQISIAEVVDSRKYDVAVLKCDKWNYSPHSEDENTEERNILHFKGRIKPWMLKYETL